MNLNKMIRQAYHLLGVVNTTNVILSGKPDKIARHIIRKRAVRIAGSYGRKPYRKYGR